ncbi:MAG: [acyl-carrier-protein] S-malonyltransferase [Gammaproteobacteria bacterium]|jgi:[acyl-carrier-protein] S-malonyltransferase
MEHRTSASLAFVFPGQGSQSVGMLRDFAAQENIISATYSEASDLLGYDLWDVVQNGPETELNRTDITQPALLAAGVAIWRLWCKYEGAKPDHMAGHSLGEYTALVCSGAIKFEDAITLVRDRGIYMQSAVSIGDGAMAAIIGIERDTIENVCIAAGDAGIVSAANFNSPVQTVIAGQKDAVNRAMVLAKEAGAKRVLLLPISVPSHCSLMIPAADQLRDRLDEINITDASIAVIQNVDARSHILADEIKLALVKQLHQPVLWVDTIQRLSDLNCRSVIESGPEKVLSRLIKRICKDIDIVNLDNIDSFRSALNYNVT